MKQIKWILALLAAVLTLGAMCFPIFAAETATATLSADRVAVGEEFTLLISIDEITASSLGVSISCDETLEILDGKWLKTGLIASFDPIKNKGAYTAGGAAPVSGDIFMITLRATESAQSPQCVSVTVIGKNGAATVLEETVTRTIAVTCATHTFGVYETAADRHIRRCDVCDYTESEPHKWSNGEIAIEATCQAEGAMRYICTVCEEEKTEPIAKLAHTAITVNAVNATCESEGYTGDQICSACEKVLHKGNAVAKLAHTYKDGACTRCGSIDPDAPTIPKTTESTTLPSPETTPSTPAETTAPETAPTPAETTAPETAPTPAETTVPTTLPPAPSAPPKTGVSMDSAWKAGVVILLSTLFLLWICKRRKAK